jgi:hypothetical protein
MAQSSKQIRKLFHSDSRRGNRRSESAFTLPGNGYDGEPQPAISNYVDLNDLFGDRGRHRIAMFFKTFQ